MKVRMPPPPPASREPSSPLPPGARSGGRSSGTQNSPAWADASDHELLQLRLCDLGLKIGGELQGRIDRLYDELARRGLTRFRPHCWLSTEWFSPDGVPGIALPFYLAHPRLMRLEKSRMLGVEGGSESACLRILRHEAGHCVSTAYRLHLRKSWRQHFGRFAEPYPEVYRPRPSSRDFVVHLDGWYAQAHPAEDFAETFAVWLTPRSRWRSRYADWPALAKLEYVDHVMREIAEMSGPPPVRSRRHIEPVSRDRRTLAAYYHAKQLQYADEAPDLIDEELRRIFSDQPRYARRPTAASFLRHVRAEVRQDVAQWTGLHAYSVDQILRDMIERCRELKLRQAGGRPATRRQVTLMVTVQAMRHLHRGHRPVSM